MFGDNIESRTGGVMGTVFVFAVGDGQIDRGWSVLFITGLSSRGLGVCHAAPSLGSRAPHD